MTDRLASLFPKPRQIERRGGAYALAGTLKLELPRGWRDGLAPELTALATSVTPLPIGATRVAVGQGTVATSEEAYRLEVAAEGITLTAPTVAGARYGLRTLRKLIDDGAVPCCVITDWPTLPYRGVQFDQGRVIERPEVIEKLLPIYADLGYNVIQLYFENAVQFPSHPKLARPYAWTLEQALRVADTATRYGIGVIPALQVLGHCNWVGVHPDYADLDEMRESGSPSGILCPSQPRTLEVLNDMIHDVAPLATSGIIHLGMDEAPYIGRCALCKPRHHAIGEGGIFVEHANAVAAMTHDAGKRPGIWGDMFYYFPESVARLDKDVLIFDWYYYTFETAPRVELYDHQPMDTGKLYRDHGIESWGCPSSFYTAMMPVNLPDEAITNARDWTRYVLENGNKGVMVTQWELSPATIDQCVPTEAAMAGFLWGDGMATPSGELLRDACTFLYGTPELAPLLAELGAARFHGHGTRRWYNAAAQANMITYTDPGADLALAARMEAIAAEIAALADAAQHPEMVRAFVPPACWLVYQYRKRALVNQAALLACNEQFEKAATLIDGLRVDALALAGRYQADWDRNRYPGDAAATPVRLRKEADIFAEEVAALKAAIGGAAYAGQLTTPVLSVHVVDKFGTMARIEAAASPDGETFTDLGIAWVLQFDSKAAGKYEAQAIDYAFPVPSLADARFVKVTASGPGHYALSGITLHQGAQTLTVQSVASDGKVENADALKTTGLTILGHPDPKSLFEEMLAAGDSSQVFTIKHGSVTAEMG
jgi:hypothetical protein